MLSCLVCIYSYICTLKKNFRIGDKDIIIDSIYLDYKNKSEFWKILKLILFFLSIYVKKKRGGIG